GYVGYQKDIYKGIISDTVSHCLGYIFILLIYNLQDNRSFYLNLFFLQQDDTFIHFFCRGTLFHLLFNVQLML
ncbi:hypothetical protein BDB01DRAFT_811054, partial [Pilobolus umbonatus]